MDTTVLSRARGLKKKNTHKAIVIIGHKPTLSVGKTGFSDKPILSAKEGGFFK